MANEFARNVQDAAFVVTTALPAQNTNANSASVDLGASAGIKPEMVEVELSVPATPSLADAQTLTFKFTHSADNSSFADLGLSIVSTGAGGAGAAAFTKRFRLPSDVLRYLRINVAASATAGNNTAVSYTWTLRF